MKAIVWLGLILYSGSTLGADSFCLHYVKKGTKLYSHSGWMDTYDPITPLNEKVDDFLQSLEDKGVLCMKGTSEGEHIVLGIRFHYFIYDAWLPGPTDSVPD